MILRHRDTPLLHFEWTSYDEVRIDFVDEKYLHLLPLSFSSVARENRQVLERELVTWLCRRTAPMGRHFMRDLMFSLGLNMRDPDFHRKSLELSLGLSLNDVYWVVPDGFSGAWKDSNLYENSFSKSMAEIAFTGFGVRATDEATTSPEMTTNGMLPKCWRRVGKEILLYKGGTASSVSTSRAVGLEPYSEFYAAQVAEALGFSHVEYNLARFKGQLCSTCPIFTSNQIGYLPAAQIPDRRQLFTDPRFAETFLFDAIIFNTDRHLGNFGYLIDNDKNEIVGAAPIFDNGYGLFSLMMLPENHVADDFTELQSYLCGKHPALFDHWLGFPSLSLKSLGEQVERLRGFRFHRHQHYNLPKDRLDLIERFLQKRVSDILNYLDKADDFIQISENRVGVNSKKNHVDVGVKVDASALVNDPLALQILWNLKANPLMTMVELSSVLGRDTRTVERKVRNLREAKLLRRTGSDKSGAWDVMI